MEYQVYTDRDIKTGRIKFHPGDIWLGNGSSLQDRFIHLITGCPFNHAALIVDEDGSTIELVTHGGIRKTAISQEREDKYYVIKIDMTDADRQHVIDFAYSCLNQKSSYDFLGLLSLTMNVLFKIPLVLRLTENLSVPNLWLMLYLMAELYGTKIRH